MSSLYHDQVPSLGMFETINRHSETKQSQKKCQCIVSALPAWAYSRQEILVNTNAINALSLDSTCLSIIIPKEFDQGFHNGKLWLYTYVHKIYPFFIWSDKGLQQRIAQSNYYQAYLLPKQVFSVDSKLLNDSHLALYTILSISLYAFCFYSLYKEMSCMSQ